MLTIGFSLCIVLAVAGVGLGLFLGQAKFGRLPQGERLERIQQSPNYRDGAFHNLVHTPQMTGEKGFVGMMLNYLFVPKERLRPSVPLPAVKTDLHSLDRKRDLVVWLGHSSLFMQLGGKRILIDPVFAGHASPAFFSTRAFPTAQAYAAADMPEIDYLIISHDHWDHLDYPTLMELKPRIQSIVCGLGVGEHFARWGFEAGRVREEDWYATLALEPGLAMHILPARHFSGRWLTRNQSLWIGCLLETPERRVLYSGDGGYGPHVEEIAERFGGVDLSIMECGQYDRQWRYMHMLPEETARAAELFRSRALLPVHAGKFSIANHAWDEPFKRITEASKGKPYTLLTPMPGQVIYLDDVTLPFSPWWEGVE